MVDNWNLLPEEIASAISLSSFKLKLRKHFYASCLFLNNLLSNFLIFCHFKATSFFATLLLSVCLSFTVYLLFIINIVIICFVFVCLSVFSLLLLLLFFCFVLFLYFGRPL